MEAINIRVPAKVTFFGEHAVVYGVPAIASTIPVYINIIGSTIENSNVVVLRIMQGIRIAVNTVIIDKESIGVEPEPGYLRRVLSYVSTAIDVCEDVAGITKRRYGYRITIDSPLPIGVGLGTSAAISVGVLSLCLVLNNYIRDVEDYRHEIAKLAWGVEKTVQGSASPMDTYTISLGGLRYIDPITAATSSIDIDYDIPIVIGYTNRNNTTAELVQKVRRLKEKNERLFAKFLSTIEDIVKEAKNAFLNRDLETLGMLMNLNHGLLQTIGVVDPQHNRLFYVLREAGALGVKTSGAGGGGAFIALAPSKEIQEKLILIAKALGAEIVGKGLCLDGVRVLRSP